MHIRWNGLKMQRSLLPPLINRLCPLVAAIRALSVTSSSVLLPSPVPLRAPPPGPSLPFFLSFHGSAFFEIKCIILPFVVAARRLFIAKMCHISLLCSVLYIAVLKAVVQKRSPCGGYRALKAALPKATQSLPPPPPPPLARSLRA